MMAQKQERRVKKKGSGHDREFENSFSMTSFIKPGPIGQLVLVVNLTQFRVTLGKDLKNICEGLPWLSLIWEELHMLVALSPGCRIPDCVGEAS